MKTIRRWWSWMIHRRPRVDREAEAAKARLAEDTRRMDVTAHRIGEAADSLRRVVREDNHISEAVAHLLRRTP